jgi:hypothetical protein
MVRVHDNFNNSEHEKKNKRTKCRKEMKIETVPYGANTETENNYPQIIVGKQAA